MKNSLYQRHIISISDLNREELEMVVKVAGDLKRTPRH